MTTQVQEILHSFDQLPEGDKQELTAEILRRLPEGSPAGTPPTEAQTLANEADRLYRLHELATPSGIPDLAMNVDHYLYGHPTVDDARSCFRFQLPLPRETAGRTITAPIPQ
jgi:hypothetical protein